MSKYRICPYGLYHWKVQKKLSDYHNIWQDELEYDYFSKTKITRSFISEKAAEKYIDEQKTIELLEFNAKKREESILPREYP